MKEATQSTVSIVTFKLFEKMSLIYGGHTTINEIRVMNAVYGYHFSRELCYQKTLVELLGISKSTVSRSVLNLVRKKWLIESMDEEDLRLRRVSLGTKAIDRAESDWQETIDWWNDAMEDFL